MKTSELKQKTEKELQQILEEKKGRFSQLEFDLASGKVKNVREIRAIKKDIARILTAANQLKSLDQKSAEKKLPEERPREALGKTLGGQGENRKEESKNKNS